MTKAIWLKIARGAGLAAGGAVVVYLIQAATEIPWETFGVWGPTVGALASVVLNAVRKWITDAQIQEKTTGQ